MRQIFSHIIAESNFYNIFLYIILFVMYKFNVLERDLYNISEATTLTKLSVAQQRGTTA